MNIGWAEFLILATIGLIVFGPERLPEMSAQLANFIKSMRSKASAATAELSNSADTKTVTDLAKDLRGFTPRGMAANAMFPGKPLSLGSPQSRDLSSMPAMKTNYVKPVFDPDAT